MEATLLTSIKIEVQDNRIYQSIQLAKYFQTLFNKYLSLNVVVMMVITQYAIIK